MPLDYTYRIQLPHRPGQLARVAGTIAEGSGLIGDVVTINVGRETSVREITAEVEDREAAEHLSAMLNDLEGVKVLWAEDRALLRHEGGKLSIETTRPVRSVQDMRDVYTPGVARACEAIAEDPTLASHLTMIGRSVAICTNGTRVLGLGDIGPVASMPVMEGKAVFYHQLAKVSAMPILINTKDVDEFVETVVRIAPTFGGIHLEDISAPECFEIERRLIEVLLQPSVRLRFGVHRRSHGSPDRTEDCAQQPMVGVLGIVRAERDRRIRLAQVGPARRARHAERLGSALDPVGSAGLCQLCLELVSFGEQADLLASERGYLVTGLGGHRRLAHKEQGGGHDRSCCQPGRGGGPGPSPARVGRGRHARRRGRIGPAGPQDK